SGPGVAQGYWNRPQESEQVFRAFTSAGKGPYLRTGDLGFVSEGELYVTGRLKDLIIIRGRNIYPQDIEATAGRCHTALRPGGAAAFSIEDADQERLVIVHELESRKIENGEEIASAIRRAVGESYDIQVWRVALIKPGALPRTSSGKTQRKLCRKLFLARELESIAEYLLESNQADQYPPDAPEEYAGADSSIPILVRKIVARTLGIPQTSVSMSDPISSYGIDSLASIEIAHGIETQLGWHVPMATLLDGTSILQITSSIASGAFPPERQIPLEPGIQSRESKARSRESKYQLSRGQQAIWFLYQLDPLSVAYNIAGAVRITSGLRIESLREAFQTLVDRHQSLRATFQSESGVAYQYIKPSSEVWLDERDASGWSDEVVRIDIEQEANRPFDLEEGPVFRVKLYRTGTDRHILLIVAHHIIADFWSLAILMDELGQIYRSDGDLGFTRLPEPR
ncbi:MAG: condensation domain-containing protein, partial [Blastocatellia bacterium]